MEMGKNGWIKIHRKMLDNPVVFKDPDHLAVWMYLLLEATHQDYPKMFGGKKVILKPGQLITGRKVISEKTGVEESKVKRIIKLFKSEQQIDQQAERYGSLISILSWDKYQADDQQTDQQLTNDCPTSDQRVTTLQEQKNKRTKEIFKDVPEAIKEEFMEWVRMRKELKKPITSEIGVTRALNKLNSLSKNPEKQRELISYAIYKNWLSFYPIPQEDKIPKQKVVEEEPRKIIAEPMPEETRLKMSALGYGNLIGKE